MDRQHVAFDSNTDFFKALKARVDAYFDETGLDRGANGLMWRKTSIIYLWVFASMGAFVFLSQALWQDMLLAISLGGAMAGVGFSIMHDGGHRAYSTTSPGVNRFMAFGLDFLGGSSYVWHHKHNVLHHTYPNLVGLDDDIALWPIARMSPVQKRLPHHRLQAFYMMPLYCILAIKWHFFDDFYNVITGKITDTKFPRPKGKELRIFLVGKLVWAAWFLVLPFSLLPFGRVALFLLVTEAFLGLIMAVVFQLAHCVDRADFPVVPEGEVFHADWAVHQLDTTVDFAPGHRFLTWYVGGLNYQAIHHLFPKVCHVHYPALSPLVAEVCEEYGVTYRQEKSLLKIFKSHLGWLHFMGKAESDSLGVAQPALAEAA